MEKPRWSQCFGKTRYAILFMALLCLTFGFSNSLIFNFTVICMDDVRNDTDNSDWINSPNKVNSLFSAVAIGSFIGTLPITYCVQKWGIGNTSAVYGILSAIATLMFPLAVNLGYPAVFTARVIQGIPTSMAYAAVVQITAEWSTEFDSATFLAILSAHKQFCNIFTMPVSGVLCGSDIGWRSAFYLHGVVSLLIFSVFLFFYENNPQKHPCVSSKELEKISRGKHLNGDKKVPYMQILRSPCVWGIWISVIGGTLGFQTFLQYGPLYLNKIIRLDVESTGFASALPYILSALVKCMIGPISDCLTSVSNKAKCIFFATLSQGAMAFCFIVMSLTSSSLIGQIAYTAGIVFSGLNAIGTAKCAQMVYRQHVHFVMSIASFIICFNVLLIPVGFAVICPDNTPDQWSRLFQIIAGIVVVASTPFIFLATERPLLYPQKTVYPLTVVSPEKPKTEQEWMSEKYVY